MAGAHAAAGLTLIGEQFDVVDLAAIVACDSFALESLSDMPRAVGEALDVVELDTLAVIAHQEKSIASPGDIAGDGSVAVDVEADLRRGTVARHVFDGDLAAVMQD